MKTIYLRVLCLTLLLAVVVSLGPIGRTEGQIQDTEISFLVSSHPDSQTSYELNVSIPYSLYQYYTQQNHFVFSPQNFPQFITPYTMKPVADSLWQIYNNTEDFTNGVLQIVHQINYQQIEESKYPVETLFEGTGDCDLFVYIAASILEAGGIPVILIYYREKLHMELGVDVGYQPTDARTGIYSITYQGVPYYIAECTGGNWRSGWRVGECPDTYQNITSNVVALTNLETASIGQVAATLRELDPSTITLHTSSSVILQNNNVTITGQILSQGTYENVTFRAKSNGGDWFTIGLTQTDLDGNFSFDWKIETPGSMEVQASWIGNRQLNGANSALISVWIFPLYLIVLLIAAIGSGVLMVLLAARVWQRRAKVLPAV